MWIEELDIRGFKRLRGIYRFAKGLTLVTGGNEAGKSTLHEALIRALFGFTKDERRRKSGNSEKDRRAPWVGDDFGINAVVHEVDGRSLKIEWDFRVPALRLLDASTGADRTGEVLGKQDEVYLGKTLLGLELAEFRSVCCLDQAAIEAVARTEDLVLALQRSVESSAVDSGVEAAVAIMNEFLKDDLGLHSLHLNPLPKGRLALLQRERQESLDGLRSFESARSEISRLASEAAKVETQLAGLRDQERGVEQSLLMAELREFESRLEEARRLEGRSRDVPQEIGQLPEDTVTEVRGRIRDLRVLEERIRELAGEVERTAERLRRLEERRAELTVEVGSRGDDAGIDSGAEARLRELRGRRAGLAAEGTAGEALKAPEPDPLPVRLGDERRRIPRLEPKRLALGGERAKLLAAVVLVGASVALGLGVHPAFFGGLVLPLVLLARIAATRARLQERERRAAEVASALAKLDLEMARALDGMGWPQASSLEERVAVYLAACERQAERRALLAALEAVKGEIGSVGQTARELESAYEERWKLRGELAELYRELRIEASDLAAGEAAFEGAVRRFRAGELKRAQANEAARALEVLLGGEAIEQLAARVAQASERFAEHVARWGSRGRVAARDELTRERELLRKEINSLELGGTELRTRIRSREEGLPDPAALEERAAELEERIARIEQARDAIRIAREALKEAARETHRRFAPRLNAALERNLPRITDGRYRVAVVDDELGIRVEAPETGRMVPVSELSRGTQDQIYLIERLEIAALLDPTTGEAPLLLDDPFARFDETRLRLALHVLRDVAAERQVVLFSEDAAIVEEAREICKGCAVISLPQPLARARDRETLQIAMSLSE